MNTRNRFDSSLVLKSKAEESASTTGSSVLINSIPEQTLAKVIVSEKSGTDPSLDLTLQGSNDDSEWSDILSLPQLTDTGHYMVPVGPQDFKYYRYKSIIGGTNTPSFNYQIYLTA